MDYYLGVPLGYVLRCLFSEKLLRLAGQLLKKLLLDFSHKINHIQHSAEIDRSQLNNGILVLWDEAKRRGLEIVNLQFHKRNTQHFAVTLNNKKNYFESNPIYLLAKKFNRAALYDDKAIFKQLLQQHNIPCPLGRVFVSKTRALQYGLELGFPLIVKPAISSLSRHVIFNIQTESELKAAIRVAKQVNYRIVVEKYIVGDVYRALLIGDAFIACVKRQPGSVVGDGKKTVEQLIDEKNAHPWRGEPEQRNTTLHKIQKTKELESFLAKQGVRFKTKLIKGQQLFLAAKMNAGNGADIANVTGLCHPENIKLFEQVHRILNIPLSGLDFICQDVALPWQQQIFAFIENNSLPYIDMHHYPSHGEPINVASKVWDAVLGELL